MSTRPCLEAYHVFTRNLLPCSPFWLFIVLATMALLPFPVSYSADPLLAQKVDGLVKQLGSERYEEREKASNSLRDLKESALPGLCKTALTSDDLEVRRRAQNIIKDIAETTLVISTVGTNMRPLHSQGAQFHYDKRFPDKPLTHAYFNQVRLRDDDLMQLCGREFSRLESLGLSDSPITNDGLIYVGRLSNLNSINLSGTSISDLKYLHELAKLTYLCVSGTKVTDEGLAPVKRFVHMWNLDLNRTNITDAGLVHIQGLKNLHGLNLSHTKITDAGLVHLRGLKELAYLWLSDTQITDEGLVHLMGLKKLRRVYVNRTRATPEGIKQLKKALPVVDKPWSSDQNAKK